MKKDFKEPAILGILESMIFKNHILPSDIFKGHFPAKARTTASTSSEGTRSVARLFYKLIYDATYYIGRCVGVDRGYNSPIGNPTHLGPECTTGPQMVF